MKYAAVARYAGEVLRALGYRVRVWVADPDHYFQYVNDTRNNAQVGFYPWIADFLTPSNFFASFSCGELLRNPHDTANPSQFCDPAVDADYDAALAARGTQANARWAALDRRVLSAAPAVPLFNSRSLLLVSDRVGNSQGHEQLGPLLDQFWVH
jgi:peptide/nickel transport system substrate-binding protein